MEIAGGYQVTTRPEYNDWVRELLDPRTPTRLSIQALETLAVIAYKQPVSRSRIGAVRGVNVDGVVRTLLSRGLIEERGEGEGGAILYGTTPYFLQRLGLDSLDDLPPLAPYLPDVDLLDEIAEAGRG